MAALAAHKEGLPQAVPEALDASQAPPEPTPGEKCVFSQLTACRRPVRNCSRSSSEGCVTAAEEASQVQLEDLQSLTTKIEAAMVDLEQAKQAVATTALVGAKKGDTQDVAMVGEQA